MAFLFGITWIVAAGCQGLPEPGSEIGGHQASPATAVAGSFVGTAETSPEPWSDIELNTYDPGSYEFDRAVSERSSGVRTLLAEIDPPGAGDEHTPTPPIQPLSGGSTTILYLNRQGGTYVVDKDFNDARQNIASAPNKPATLAGWDVPDNDWRYVLDCVRDVLGPFDVAVTDEDPQNVPHVEAMIGGTPGEIGIDERDVAGVSPFRKDCGVVDNSIVFVFPTILGGSLRRVCETVAQEFAHSYGIDHLYVCEDPMTYRTNCDTPKRFQFRKSPCGTSEIEPCRCDDGRRTQNSAKMLLNRLGRGERPELWLTNPSSGDYVDSDSFTVAATVTHPPTALELAVDGVPWPAVVPQFESGQDYQTVKFRVAPESGTLRPGTHHLQLRATYPTRDLTVEARVHVADGRGIDLISGCSTGGRSGRSCALGLLLALAALHSRRRRQ